MAEITPTDPKVAPLFASTTLGALALRNRIVMAPMTRSRASTEGVPSPLAVTYYAERAEAGLLITEGTQPTDEGQGYARTPGIHTDEQVEAWRRITDEVHRREGLIALQIMHVGRVGHPLNQRSGGELVAPSAIAAKGTMFTDTQGPQPMPTPRALRTDEIARLVRDHARAAARAREAGFDAVELHGANGYLSNQFLASGTNRRTDAYGGSPENRARFVVEVLEAMCDAIGADRVGLRVSPGGTFNDISDEDPALTFRALFRALEGRGLAYLHIMRTGWPGTDALIEEGLPAKLVLTGGFDPHDAAEAVRSGRAEAIGFARHFLANPDLPARIAHGWPLTPPDMGTLYTPGPEGYVGYPRYDAERA